MWVACKYKFVRFPWNKRDYTDLDSSPEEVELEGGIKVGNAGGIRVPPMQIPEVAASVWYDEFDLVMHPFSGKPQKRIDRETKLPLKRVSTISFAGQSGELIETYNISLGPPEDPERERRKSRGREEAAISMYYMQLPKRSEDGDERRQICQTAIALRDFHQLYAHYPATDRSTKYSPSGLSWRVHILPQLGCDDLYYQFNLDEPWDSPHNRELIARMPDVYKTREYPSRARRRFIW